MLLTSSIDLLLDLCLWRPIGCSLLNYLSLPVESSQPPVESNQLPVATSQRLLGRPYGNSYLRRQYYFNGILQVSILSPDVGDDEAGFQ